MSNPLPSVEVSCAALQQEESQRDVLQNVLSSDNEYSAMYSRGPQQHIDKPVTCTNCGGKNHSNDKCWSIVGFPKWHHRYRPPPQRKQTPPTKWTGNKPHTGRMTNSVQGTNFTTDQA